MVTPDQQAKENKALRDLVDALKAFIAARDNLWSLNFFDRIFHFGKCREILHEYDASRDKVHSAILTLKEITESPTLLEKKDLAEKSSDAMAPVVTLEEFEMLLGKPSILKKAPGRNNIA